MAVWVVRQDSPQSGAWDDLALANGVAVIDFGLDEGGIDRFPDRLTLEIHLLRNAPDVYGYRLAGPGRVRNAARQVWDFYKRIGLGDLAVYHIWQDGAQLVRVGEFLEADAYQESFPNHNGWRDRNAILFQVRRVNWMAEDIPMAAFDPSLHLDAPGTVYRPRYAAANGRPRYAEADAHVRAVLQRHRPWEGAVDEH